MKSLSRQLAIWMSDLILEGGGELIGLSGKGDCHIVLWWKQGREELSASVSLQSEGVTFEFSALGRESFQVSNQLGPDLADKIQEIYNEGAIKEMLTSFGFPNVFYCGGLD